MSYFPEDIPFMSEEERKANGIKTAKEIETQKTQLSKEDSTFDCISRKATITEIKNYERDSTAPIDYVKIVEQMSSAQPSRIEQALHGKAPEEQYKILYQLMFEYANTFNDARRAVIDWLGE